MNYLKGIVNVFCLLFLQAGAQHTAKKDFTQDWKFKLDSHAVYSAVKVDDAGWRTLNLPHDWSIEGSFSKNHPATPGGGALPGGVGWYRKTFQIPFTHVSRKLYLQFDGVYRNSEVWINGHYLGKRPNGYISFQYDLTPYLRYGGDSNVITVKVDNIRQPNSRWYSGSGIYRNVWLIRLYPLHIAPWGTYISTPKVTASAATVHVETRIQNTFKTPQAFEVTTTVFDAAGKKVAATSRQGHALQDSGVTLQQTFTIPHPKLWSPDAPYLYKAVSTLAVNGKVVDTYETPLGIRTFYFDREKGFYINGKHLKIKGVCQHHDLGALGAAINRRALERQLQILKDMGCNAIRTAHNPPAPELLQLADRMGFIIMNEAYDMWAKSKSPYDYSLDWAAWHKRDLEVFMKRDRNHPSVFVWSVGNEIGEQWGDEKKGDTTGRNIARELVSIVKSLDTTRPITTANNEVNPWNNLLQSGAFELLGYNYNHQKWGSFLQDWPGKKLIVTESTSALQTRGHYDLLPFDSIRRWPEAWDKPIPGGGNKDFTVSAYDHVSAPWGSTHEESLKEMYKHDHVSGLFVWTGFDYLGEPTPYSWPARSSYFGIIDLAGFPKDVYYLYQSQWTDKKVLHLYPHWNWQPGDTVDMVAYYNNADEAELFLNGSSLGVKSKTGNNLHVVWRVPFTPGTLKIVSRKGGKTVLTKEVKTAGAPAKILLKADRSKLKRDGKDLSFITATVVDEEGVVVPYADNNIRFTLSGPGFIAGVDNGDPTSHQSFKANQRKAFHGLALAIIQNTGVKGKINVSAAAPGLAGSALVLEVK